MQSFHLNFLCPLLSKSYLFWIFLNFLWTDFSISKPKISMAIKYSDLDMTWCQNEWFFDDHSWTITCNFDQNSTLFVAEKQFFLIFTTNPPLSGKKILGFNFSWAQCKDFGLLCRKIFLFLKTEYLRTYSTLLRIVAGCVTCWR